VFLFAVSIPYFFGGAIVIQMDNDRVKPRHRELKRELCGLLFFPPTNNIDSPTTQMVSFFKKKPLAADNSIIINNTTNLNTESSEDREKELQLLASKFTNLPYHAACDTISAHEKHSLPQAKQLFAAYDSNDKNTGNAEQQSSSSQELRLGGKDTTFTIDEPLLSSKETFEKTAKTASMSLGHISQESTQTLTSIPEPTNVANAAKLNDDASNLNRLNNPPPSSLLQNNQGIFNSSISLLNVDADMIISPATPDAVFLSAIPKEFTAPIMDPLPLKKTVSFQETVTTHTHADFQARLEEIRRQKMEGKGLGFFGKLVYGIKRMFSSC
jgi:hypothetical protein